MASFIPTASLAAQGPPKMLKLADKTSNLPSILCSPPINWSQKRKQGSPTHHARLSGFLPL